MKHTFFSVQACPHKNTAHEHNLENTFLSPTLSPALKTEVSAAKPHYSVDHFSGFISALCSGL